MFASAFPYFEADAELGVVNVFAKMNFVSVAYAREGMIYLPRAHVNLSENTKCPMRT